MISILGEPDIRILTNNRKYLIDCLKILYLKIQKNENLSIYGVKSSSLAKYYKGRSDIIKGVESKLIELIGSRIEAEDLLIDQDNLNKARIEQVADSDSDCSLEMKEEESKAIDVDIREMNSEIVKF